MSLGLWVYVIVAAFVLVVYGVAIYIAWWALFHDRPNGRRRCPRCWQDLTHTPGMTCNECGRTAARESELGRTRRRWSLATIAMSSCVALAGWVYWTLADRNWTGYAPTSVLVTTLPFVQNVNGTIYREIAGRATRDRLDSGQWARLLRRCARGDWWARPVDDDWQEKYGQLVLLARRTIDREEELEWDDAVRQKLLDLPPAIELTSRSVWPVDADPHFHFQMRDWWPVGPACRITLAPRVEGAAPEVFYRSGRRLPWSSLSISVPRIDRRAREVIFDVRVERRIDAEDEPLELGGTAPPDELVAAERWRLMSEQEITIPVRFDEPAAVTLEPVDSLELTQAVWTVFSWGVVKYAGGGPGPVRFYFNRGPTNRTDFDGTAMGVRVELLKGERLARRLDMWWLAGPTTENSPVASAVSAEDPDLLVEVDDDEAWVIRITGDQELALRAGDAEAYWAGQFQIPLTLHVRDGKAPELRWWR